MNSCEMALVNPATLAILLAVLCWLAMALAVRRWRKDRRHRAREVEPYLGDCIPPQSVGQEYGAVGLLHRRPARRPPWAFPPI